MQSESMRHPGGEFKAPWNPTLTLVSLGAGLLLLAVSVITARAAASEDLSRWLAWVVPALPVAILGGAALFTVRGYELARDRLVVRRLLWGTEFGLSGLVRAWHDPRAMRGSIRLFGNGGLFSFTGLFRNRLLGNYHAYATDDRRAVILVFEGKTILVTPDDPARFLGRIGALRPGVQIGPPRDAR